MVIPIPTKDMKPMEDSMEKITIKIPKIPIRNPEWLLDGNEPIAMDIYINIKIYDRATTHIFQLASVISSSGILL